MRRICLRSRIALYDLMQVSLQMSDARRVTLMRRRKSFLRDQRGAIAFETLLVYIVMVTALLLPLADVGVAGLQYTQAWAALRNYGQCIQYNNIDPTNVSGWTNPCPGTFQGYTMSSLNVYCGDNSPLAACTSSNAALPMWFSYSTTFTLHPLLLTSVLCNSGNANPCQYAPTYSERFD